MVPGDNCLHRSPLRGVGVPSPVTLAGSKCGLLPRHWSPLRDVGAVYSPEEEEEEEEEEDEEEDLFEFNDTIEGPRAPAVKPGRITQVGIATPWLACARAQGMRTGAMRALPSLMFVTSSL